ncbi:RsiW-degrading membrane proteinase PrsW (M82 family) [Branchiibius hedensis]|uniref:Membrane proteinase PrsW, cleaves anti-sigma factor RsiW, M82 family n=1 Tax=Branchiibius hedensis TaxID=672460 RepID=A0A2Y8ZU64_9MICO|nr:PrsW family intramembrane metalloprotease [Branchiibius hedensis]PWJ24570.1 RsiW-degrading membrane proteinase PrsW (M82 family) [Branchiibius hedensis]SSA33387.1 Membrane proteinase PrsW, cleaves anti-sigma factor RsiW, M82 family [Branchiibius hedensis]
MDHHLSNVLPVPASVRRNTLVRRILLWSVVAILIGACGVTILSLINAQSGATATGLGILLSAVVVGIVVPAFLWVDRLEREPTHLLLFAFGWGACVATLGAAFLNDAGGYLLGATSDNNSVVAVFVAPVVEETLKGLPVLLIWLVARRELDGIVDGIVYAGLSAAGFAMIEDVIYLSNGYAEQGDAGLFHTFFVRVTMSPFVHPMFTICTGVGIGIAATARSWGPRIFAPLLGWLCAIGLHALWNAGAVLAESGWLAFYIFLQVPLFAGFIGILIAARHSEGHAIRVNLTPYVDQGWLSTPEVRMLSSVRERQYARAWAKSHGAEREMREFQDAASELAMHRARIERGAADTRTVREERALLDLVTQRRQQFLGTALYRWPDLVA